MLDDPSGFQVQLDRGHMPGYGAIETACQPPPHLFREIFEADISMRLYGILDGVSHDFLLVPVDVDAALPFVRMPGLDHLRYL